MEVPKPLEVPASLFKRHHGISLDFGSSQTKIVYAIPVGDKVRLNFASFAKENYEEALQFVVDTFGSRLEPGETVNVTGINCDQEKVQQKLNIRTNVLMETVMLMDGFHFLAVHYPLSVLAYPPSEAVNTQAKKYGNGYIHNKRFTAAMSEGILKNPRVYDEDYVVTTDVSDRVEFPALLFLIGSCYIAFLIDKDGTARPVDGSQFCGRSLYALGSLLTGSKSFEEFADLASKGSSDNINVDCGECLRVNKKGAYNGASGDELLFIMGKAVRKDISDFSREDLAAGCVSAVAQSIADTTQMTAAAYNAKQVIFLGGLSSGSQFIREQIWAAYSYKDLVNPLGVHSKAYFLKHGPFMPALGALLSNLQLV